MKRIPADIDQLMWTIAEGGDLTAADDFEKRFPEFRGELASRLVMVRGLRQSKPAETVERTIPRFVPRSPEVTAPRRPVWTVALLGGLATVAFASYLVVINLPKPSAKPNPTPPGQSRDPVVVPIDDRQRTGGEPGEMAPVENGGKSDTPAKPTLEMPWDKPQSLAIEGAPLQDVLKLIATTCHLQIELAPGMPNPNVDVAYQGRTGMEMLKDLGRQYKFTPLYQGNGQVLIVPAIDFTNPE